jgi:putative hydrolase of HD superfamily
MGRPNVQRLIELQALLLKFSATERRLDVPPDFKKQENDTEHSYNLAIAAWFLSEYFPELNRDQLIRLALVHDLVEIYAGDTYFYAEEAERLSKIERESKALERLDAEWPDFPGLTATIHAYEQKDSAEAKFIYALDKIMPIMVIYLGEGHTWHKEGITHDQLHTAKLPKVSASPEVTEYYNQLHDLLLQHPRYFPAH